MPMQAFKPTLSHVKRFRMKTRWITTLDISHHVIIYLTKINQGKKDMRQVMTLLKDELRV